jgi:ATP-binding cassette, subfamily B, multidrug efflux pump
MDGFMGTVHRQMRLVTKLTVALQTVNALLLAGIAGLAIYGWYAATTIAVAIALVMRIRAMSDWVLWEIAGLFENIGTIQDGMNTIALPRQVDDRRDARDLFVTRGEIEFDRVAFHYGCKGGVIGDLSLKVRPGERIGIVGRSGAGKSTLVNLLLRFHDIEGGRITIDGLRCATGEPAPRDRRRHPRTRPCCTARSATTSPMGGRRRAKPRSSPPSRDHVDAAGRRGLNAHAGERGVKLSGGQRQRIAIAPSLTPQAICIRTKPRAKLGSCWLAPI